MAETPILQAKVIRGSITIVVITLLASVFAYLIRILFSRTLSIEDYGLFYAVFGFITFSASFIDLGFGYAAVYLIPKFVKVGDYQKAWQTYLYSQAIALVMAAIVALLLIINAHFLTEYYFKIPNSENLIYIFSVYLVISSLMAGLINIYNGLQQAKYYSAISLVRWLFTLTFSVIIFLFNNPGVLVYAVALAIGHIVTVLFFLVALFKKYPNLTKNKINWQPPLFKEMSSLAIPALLTSVTYSLVIFADSFFLTLFKGVRDVGIYNVVFPIASASMILINPVNGFILPLVSHLMEGQRDKVRLLINRVLEIIPFIGVYFGLFMILFPSMVASIFFGQKWLGLIENPLRVMAVAFIVVPLSGMLETILLGVGKVKERLKIIIFITITNICLDALLIWKFGVMGSALNGVIMSLLSVSLFVVILTIVVKIKIPLLFYAKLLLISVGYLGLINLFKISPHNLWEFIYFGIIYTLSFIGVGYLLKVFDIELIKQVLGVTDDNGNA